MVIDFLIWIIGISCLVIGFNIILIAILEYACADRPPQPIDDDNQF